MNAQSIRAAGGSLLMWFLAGAWWFSSDRSLAVTMGALAIGALGTAIAIRGMRQPESRTRDAIAAVVAALVGASIAFVLAT